MPPPEAGLRPEIEPGRMRVARSVQSVDSACRRRRKRMDAPAWITDELVADTLRTWQSFYSRRLTRHDAIEMLLAVGNLIDCLECVDDQAVPGSGPSLKSRTGA
jgi:hypothetical protein